MKVVDDEEEVERVGGIDARGGQYISIDNRTTNVYIHADTKMTPFSIEIMDSISLSLSVFWTHNFHFQ